MNTKSIHHLAIIVLGAMFFIPFNGMVHLFDWDEAIYGEIAREMIITGDYLHPRIDFLPFMEKPPLFFWLQVVAMKIFGINEFAVRFPNAICGILTLLVLYTAGTRLVDRGFGLLWVLSYAGSLLPFFYFKSAIIDPWYNLFIFSGLYFFFLMTESQKQINMYAALSGLLLGLALLTKGPVALILFVLPLFLYFIIKQSYPKLTINMLVFFFLPLLLTGSSWFIIQIFTGNTAFIPEFIAYQIKVFSTPFAGHTGFPLFHVVILFFGVFPTSVFAVFAFKKQKENTERVNNFRLLMIAVLLVVLVLFSLVKTKLVHYSSLAYFPLTFLASLYMYNAVVTTKKISNLFRNTLFITAIIIALLVASIPLLMIFRDDILRMNLIKDVFIVENIKADVYWSGKEIFIPLFWLIMLFIGLFVLNNNMYKFICICSATMLFCFIIMLDMVPKVEGHIQNAAIEYYKEAQQKDCYMRALGFKSYAYLFYSQKQPTHISASYTDWLLYGDIDKPAYFVCKKYNENRYLSILPLEKVAEKNGYVLLVRYPKYVRK